MFKPAPDKAFEGNERDALPLGTGGSRYRPDYRPDETQRLVQAHRWLGVARGESPEPKE